LFSPPGVDWTPVSAGLTTSRRIGLLTGLALVLVGPVIAAVFWAWAWIAVGLILLAGAWGWGAIGRVTRSWGYAERDDDLLIKRGIMFRRLYVIPYGRMQFVDVQAGPLDRRCGISTLRLHTASTDDDATLPGLSPDEAARLRDRLTSRGQARMAGL
jgi:membrane protein YdbS with pleckstrin-like domain